MDASDWFLGIGALVVVGGLSAAAYASQRESGSAYREGYDAAGHGATERDAPYPKGSASQFAWFQGLWDAKDGRPAVAPGSGVTEGLAEMGRRDFWLGPGGEGVLTKKFWTE